MAALLSVRKDQTHSGMDGAPRHQVCSSKVPLVLNYSFSCDSLKTLWHALEALVPNYCSPGVFDSVPFASFMAAL